MLDVNDEASCQRVRDLCDWCMLTPMFSPPPELAERADALSQAELRAVDNEMHRRASAFQTDGNAVNFEAQASPLCRERGKKVADWLIRRPHITEPLSDRQFRETFADTTYLEFALAMNEMQRRLRALEADQ